MKGRFLLMLMILPLLHAAADDSTSVATGDAGDFSYHVRFALSGKEKHSVSLSWHNKSDSALYTATVEIPQDADDPLFPSRCSYSVARTCHGSTDICSEGRFDTRFSNPPRISAVLRRSAAGTAVTFGAQGPDASVAVPFDADTIAARASGAAHLLRHSLIIRNRRSTEVSEFRSEKEIAGYLAASTNPMETEWIYLDRDSVPDEARLVGHYRLATIACAGGYDIVYISGGSSLWKTGDIKGRLLDTPFQGHYDLYWLTDARTGADSEASAGIHTDGLILELSFPSLRSRIRFRRAH